MSVHFFKYYLNDSYNRSELQDFVEEQLGFELTDHQLEVIRGRFYEVGFNVSLDTETDELKIVGIR